VARWNGTNWESFASALSGACGYDSVSTVCALAMYNGELIAAGTFTAAGGVAVHNIARWDGAMWSPLGGGLTRSSSSSRDCPMVRALAVYDGALIAAGLFDHAGDTPVPGVARWDGTTWTRLGTAGFSEVSSLALYRGGLVAGCWQYDLGVERGNGVALWDGENWSSLGGGLDGHVDALLARAGELVASGVFAHAGGVVAHNIAAWDGGQWHALGSGIDTWGNYPRTGALVDLDGDLIVGGVIGTAGGVPVACIARWDGATWHALGAGVIQPLFDAAVYAAVIHADQLVVGGDFARAGDAAAENVARWDGHAWSGMGPAGCGMDGLVAEITPYQGQLVVCGRFSQGDLEQPTGSLAGLGTPGNAWTPDSRPIPPGSSRWVCTRTNCTARPAPCRPIV
jgi:trimeric autotransporter adhesin